MSAPTRSGCMILIATRSCRSRVLASQEHGRHSALGDLPLDGVAGAQGLRQLVRTGGGRRGEYAATGLGKTGGGSPSLSRRCASGGGPAPGPLASDPDISIKRIDQVLVQQVLEAAHPLIRRGRGLEAPWRTIYR